MWKVEMLGAYGWEAVSTAFLQDGRGMAGSNQHYALGTYSVEKDTLKVQAMMFTFAGSRTLFG